MKFLESLLIAFCSHPPDNCLDQAWLQQGEPQEPTYAEMGFSLRLYELLEGDVLLVLKTRTTGSGKKKLDEGHLEVERGQRADFTSVRFYRAVASSSRLQRNRVVVQHAGCNCHSTGTPRSSPFSVIPSGCLPSRIASTISGASSVSRRTRVM